MKQRFLTAVLAVAMLPWAGCCIAQQTAALDTLPDEFGTFAMAKSGPRGSVYVGRWNGWQSLLITDGKTAAVAVPSLARVMYFGPLEGPNLIWVNDQWKGKTRADWPQGQRGYQNFGGWKLWTKPWLGWPPPVDGVPAESYTVNDDGSLTVTQPPHEAAGVQIAWTLGFEGDHLRVDCRFVNTAETDKTYQVWSVIQARADKGFYLLPPTPDTKGYTTRPGEKIGPGNLRVESDVLAIRPATDASQWIGSNPNEGWVVYARPLDGRTALLICGFDASRQWPYADQVSNVIYNSPGNAEEQYTEIEGFSPVKTIAPGERMDWVMRWYYRNVNGTMTFDVDLAPLVKTIKAAQ
jgi:hypothetical protein